MPPATIYEALLDKMCEDVLKKVWMCYKDLERADFLYNQSHRRCLAETFELHRAIDFDSTQLGPNVEVVFSDIGYHCRQKRHTPEDLVWDPQCGGDDDSIAQSLFSTEAIGCCNNCYSACKRRAITAALEDRACELIWQKLRDITEPWSDHFHWHALRVYEPDGNSDNDSDNDNEFEY